MYIVVDIGGTKTRIAGSSDLKTLTEPIIYDTPKSYEDGIAAIAEHARAIAGDESIECIAGGVPRLAHDKRTVLPPRESSNIRQWDGKNIADDLERALNTKALLCNDAALVGLGEAHFGAGVGANIVVYITVSTGVNGVRVVNGVADTCAQSYSIGDQYSLGDQYLTTADPLIPWENMISGRAVHERFGMHPRELGKDHAVWEELARITAIGLHNTILHWAPNRVVLGGSMFKEIGISVERVDFYLKQIMKSAEPPEVVHSSLGDIGGLYGGLIRLQQNS